MDKLSYPPVEIGSDYSRRPIPGQLSLNTHGRRMPGERNARIVPTAANGYTSWPSDDEKDGAVEALARQLRKGNS